MNRTILEEIDLLLQFGEYSTRQGLKIHSDASDTTRAAANRLYNKGFISQADGGYLTDRGITAVDHSQHLMALLNEQALLTT